MTINFNPRKKFIFDHYLKSDGTVVSNDEIRKLFLNYLIYKGSLPETKLTSDLELNAINAYIFAFCQIVQEGKKFKIKFKEGIDDEQINKKLLEYFSTVAEKEKPDGQIKLHQDFNFTPEGIAKNYTNDKFSLTVQTKTRQLNDFDIYSNDDFFTNGALDPNKDETTLKFAYAFKTTKVDGELEIVSKETSLSTNYQKWQVEADNENNFSTNKIDKLKNLIYLTPQTEAIEKDIESNPGDGIGVDKIYNVVTITVPGVDKEGTDVIFDYINSNVQPSINLLDLSNVGLQTLEVYQSLYGAAALDYFLSDIDTLSSQTDNKTKALITGFSNYVLKYYGFDIDFVANNFVGSVGNTITPQIQNLVQKQLGATAIRLAKQALPETQLATAISSDAKSYLDYFGSVAPGALFYTSLSTPLIFDRFLAYLSTEPINVTMAYLFSAASQQKQNKKDFTYGSVQDNLIKRGKLIGLKLVKSETPLDTSNIQSFEDSIIQTYHLPITARSDAQQIRIYDSQIVYGKTYYYTLLGIYNVDGKFYYYDNLQVKQKEVAAKTELIIIDNVKNNGEFVNPCCTLKQYNEKLGLGINPNTDFATWKFNIVEGWQFSTSPQEQAKPGVVQLRKIANDLASIAAISTLAPGELFNGESKQLEQLKTNVSNFKKNYSDEEIQQTRCWICRRSVGEPSKSFYAYLESQLNDDAKQYLQSFLKCTDFGWATDRGNVGDKLADFSLEDFTDFEPLTDKEDPKTPNNKKCKISQIVTLEEGRILFDEFSFNLFESNASRVHELPLQPSLKSENIDVVPMPPDVTFVPLADVNNKIKIKFQETTQYDYLPVQPDAALKTLNSTLVGSGNPLFVAIQSKSFEIANESGIDLPAGGVLARSENDIAQVHVRKLDRTPSNLQDLIDNGEQFTLDYLNGQTAYISNLIPNQKYYYTFISRDIAGLYSNASFTYEVELVEDSGFVYAKINIYEYPVEEEKIISKTFQKLLKIKPSFEEELLIIDAHNNPGIPAQLASLFSTITIPSKPIYGPDGNTGQPPRFKIRVRSKKSKRFFDINLKYTMTTKKITKASINQVKSYSELIDEKIDEA